MSALRFLSIILLVVLPNIRSFAQHIEERVFLTEKGLENVEEKLDEGYRAFVFDAEVLKEKQMFFFQGFLERQVSPDVLVFLVRGDDARLSEKLESHPISQFVVRDTGALTKPLTESKLLIFGSDASLFNTKHWINRGVYENDSLKGEGWCRLLSFIDINQKETEAVADRILNLTLEKEGKMPNFIRTQSPSLWKPRLDSISNLSFNHADVLFGNRPLKGVKWKELPGLRSCGHIITTSGKLSPKKRGYWFSPDIFSFSSSVPAETKVFRAYQYDVKEALRYYLPLHENTSNTVFPYDNGTYTDVKFIDDPERGHVAYFNGETSYIDFRNSHTTDFSEITVSTWIKPEKISGSLSLIGKGEAFSAKIFDGRLQFTTPGIKDHYSEKITLKTGEWVHLTYVYSLEKKVYFYLNGRLVGEAPASALEQTDHSILIGTNLWGQYYKGCLSEFCVWNRALSDDEVRDVYALGVVPPTADRTILYASTGGALLIALLLFIYIYYKRKAVKDRPEAKGIAGKNTVIPTIQAGKGKIQLLEEFKLTNREGKDITFRLSPKRKELLLLLILYTLKEGGISSQKMAHLLWPGFSPESVKNNRSTHIREIRNLLEEELNVRIVYSNKVWRFEAGNDVAIDINEIDRKIPLFSRSKKEISGKEDLLECAKLVSRGPLLPQTDLEWVDKFKSDYGNAVLDVLVPCIENPDWLTDKEALEVIRAILTIDPLYESAVRYKVTVLMKGGKHTLAKKAIEQYKRLYENFYGEVCEPDFLAQAE
ncbi:LamG-like jellyroll fold domain-containing protein [Sinomicrobium weinanense]|uniref:LamG-like jellyroll fold domain-containing protein n=1 Tax=Sinomicrobium weinanense TaxID=2842200 RepID=A0A926JUD1_9FLAO|nr:LamG-like jellyroll fold domain-containing protein [Sinomicrobium weinanense]MBC9797698.1 hypothetical protein [Sinomicrobium weinanense]MBU3125815.1 hypothetical protein [Sinomicrobium weinanense]